MFFIWVLIPVMAWIINVFYIHYKISLIVPGLFSLIITAIIMIPALKMTSLYTMFIYHFVVISWVIDLLHLLMKTSLSQTLYRYSIIPFLLTCLVMAYGLYNMKDIRRHEYDISTPLSHSYKIVMISDMHYGISLNKEELHKIVDRINQEKADLLVLAGDIFDENTSREGAKEAIEQLGQIQTTYGNYYVFGNHDQQLYTNHRVYQTKELIEWMQKHNIKVLQDSVISINDEIDLIGRKDKSDKTRKEIQNFHLNHKKYNIVVDHQPVEYEAYQKAGVSLDLSGHTHDGQIFPIGVINRVLPTTGQYIGYKRMGSFQAVVTSGIAGWGYPIRTEGHSEYAVIQLHKN